MPAPRGAGVLVRMAIVRPAMKHLAVPLARSHMGFGRSALQPLERGEYRVVTTRRVRERIERR